eukprot:808340-Pelagomonas_calceolata.AAC.1
MCNSMLSSNDESLRRVLKADLNIYVREPSCWTAQVLGAFKGLRRRDSFVQAVRQGLLFLFKSLLMTSSTGSKVLGY